MGSNNSNENGPSQIDESLKRVFQETLDEDIPDRFKSLLDQLKQQDGKQEPAKGSSEEQE